MFLREGRGGDPGALIATSLISAEPDGTLFSTVRAQTNRRSIDRYRAISPQWPALAEGKIAECNTEFY